MKPVPLAQLFLMTAIVTTMLLPPLAGLAWLGCTLLGAPFEPLVTFGGALKAPVGVSAWWAIVFLPALGYGAWLNAE